MLCYLGQVNVSWDSLCYHYTMKKSFYMFLYVRNFFLSKVESNFAFSYCPYLHLPSKKLGNGMPPQLDRQSSFNLIYVLWSFRVMGNGDNLRPDKDAFGKFFKKIQVTRRRQFLQVFFRTFFPRLFQSVSHKFFSRRFSTFFLRSQWGS